jgi:hypothetical protein
MVQLTQKYIKYFYVALIIGISIQLLNSIIITLNGGIQFGTVMQMLLSITNIILLIDSIRHNLKQQFTECKVNAKILRVMIALLVMFQTLPYIGTNFDGVILINYLIMITLTELVLTFRIKIIEHLEELADKYKKDGALHLD